MFLTVLFFAVVGGVGIGLVCLLFDTAIQIFAPEAHDRIHNPELVCEDFEESHQLIQEKGQSQEPYL